MKPPKVKLAASGLYKMRRRIPKRYASVDPRSHLEASLRTDSLSEAQEKARKVWEDHVAGWELALAGRSDLAAERFEAARKLAGRMGFRYLTAEEVAKLPTAEIRDRMLAAKAGPAQEQAALGLAKEPRFTVRDAFDLYLKLARPKMVGKSPDQRRRWMNPRKRAVENFCKVNGNPFLDELSATHFIDFQDWWIARVEKEGLSPASANKDMVYIKAMLAEVAKKHRIKLEVELQGWMLPEKGPKKIRPPFSPEWIRDVLLKKGAFDGLNDQARDIPLAMLNTCARLSEIVNVGEDHIHAWDPIPHIEIVPDGRELKNATSLRKIPLVGVSLEAFRRHPKGFTRYFDNAAAASALINKYMRHRGLMESPDHSLYSLRHSGEDAMLRAGVDERVRRDIMGHSLAGRQRYGDGGGLEERQKALERIAF